MNEVGKLSLPNPFSCVSGSVALDEEDEPIEWICEGWLPKGRITLLAGDQTIGKSPLSYQLAFCITWGIPFLGIPTQKGSVMICDYENSWGQSKKYLRDHSEFYNLPVQDHLIIRSHEKVDGVMSFAGDMSAIQEHKPDVAIIDPLGSALPDIENMRETNEVARRTIRECRQKTKITGTSFMLLHNLRKESDQMILMGTLTILDAETKHKVFNKVRGGGALTNGVDLRLMAEEHGEQLVVGGRMRGMGDVPNTFLERQSGNSARSEGGPIGYALAEKKVQGLQSTVVAALKKLENEFTFTEAKVIWGKSDSSADLMLQKAMKAGAVEKFTPMGAARESYRKTVAGAAL